MYRAFFALLLDISSKVGADGMEMRAGVLVWYYSNLTVRYNLLNQAVAPEAGHPEEWQSRPRGRTLQLNTDGHIITSQY